MNSSSSEFPISPSRRGTITQSYDTTEDISVLPPKPKLLQPSSGDPEVLTPEEIQDLVQVYIKETGQTLSTLDGLRSALQKSNIFVSGPTLNTLFLKHVSKSQANDRSSSDATYSMSCAGFVAICNAIKLLSIQERQVVKGGGGDASPLLSNRRTSLMPSARRVAFDGRTSAGGGGMMMGSTSQHFSSSRRDLSSSPRQRPQVVERLLSSAELADRYAEEDLVEALRDMQPPSIPHSLYGEITSRAKVLDGMKSNDRTGKLSIPNFSMRTALRSGTPTRNGKEVDSPWDRASIGVLRQYAAMRKLGNPSPSASKRHSLAASTSFQSSPSAMLGVPSEVADSITDGISEEVLQILAGLTTEEMTTLAGVERAIIREKVSLGTNEGTTGGVDSMDPFALYPYLEFANDLDGLDDVSISPRMTPLRMYAVDAILQQVRNGTLAQNVNQVGLLSSPLMYATLTPDDIHGLLASDTPTDNTNYKAASKPKRSDDAPITAAVTYAQLAEQDDQQQQFDADLTSKSKTVLATLTACGVRPEDELECLKAFRTASALMYQKRMLTSRTRAKSFRKPSLESVSAQLVDPENVSHPLLSAAAVVDPIYTTDQLNRLSEREIKVLEKLAAVEAHLFLSPAKAATIESVAERSEGDLEKRGSMTFGKSLRNRKKSFMGALPTRDFDLPMDPSQMPTDSFDEMEESGLGVEHLRRSYPLLVGLRDAVGVFVEQQRLIEERVGMVTERPQPFDKKKRHTHKSSSSADGRMSPTSSTALGSRHFDMSDNCGATLDGAHETGAPRSKPYRNLDENQKRWDHLRHLEALKSQADEERKIREREQESRLVTAFSPCDMPYEDYYFVPQLKQRPKKVPLFLKKSFSPVEENSVSPPAAHASSTSTSFAGQPSLGGESSVASLRSPHRYQTALDRRGDKYFTEPTPVSHRARSNSVYHQGVKLQHAFLKPITKTSSPGRSNLDGLATPEVHDTPVTSVSKVPQALSPSMVSMPASRDEEEMRVRTQGRVGKKSLYPEGTVGCSLRRSSQRSQSTEPSTGNQHTSTEPSTRPASGMEIRSKEGLFTQSRPGSKKAATPVPAGVQAILSKFLGDAAAIQKSSLEAEAGAKTEKRPPAVYRLQGKRKPIGFKA